MSNAPGGLFLYRSCSTAGHAANAERMVQVEKVTDGRIAAAECGAEFLGIGFTRRQYANRKRFDGSRFPKRVENRLGQKSPIGRRAERRIAASC